MVIIKFTINFLSWYRDLIWLLYNNNNTLFQTKTIIHSLLSKELRNKGSVKSVSVNSNIDLK